MTRTVLIISPYFPPSTLAGVHRARHLAKHLPASGWHPIILCVDETCHEEPLDPDLAQLVPQNAEIVKTGALPVRWTRPFGVGEISLRAWWHLRRHTEKLVGTRQVAAVLITGSPYYPMLFARSLKQRFSVPIVLDFQDPWASAWGASQQCFSKAGISHRIATILEPRVLRSAAFVTSVSDTQNAQLAARYRWLDKNRMAAIPIGGDPDDFASLRNGLSQTGEQLLDGGFFNLSYVGTFMPRSELLFRVLFRAFKRLREKKPELAMRMRMNFIGTSNQAFQGADPRVSAIAATEGVVDAVLEVPQRVPYLQALRVLARSDCLLLIGSDESHYTASKIYPALMSGRPFLSLFHRSSSSHAILDAAGGGRAFVFETPSELAELETPLAEALSLLAENPNSLDAVNRKAYCAFEAREIAAQFGGIFDRVANERNN